MSWIWLVLAIVAPLQEAQGQEAQGQDVDQIEIRVLAFKQREIGSPFSNRFGRPSAEEALQRLEGFVERPEPTRLLDFFGAEVAYINVTEIWGDLSAAEAEGRVRQALSSNVVWPRWGGLALDRLWSEATPVLLSAQVCFRHPEIKSRGVLSGCGRLELSRSSHLFFQDASGISWWYRMPPHIFQAYRFLLRRPLWLRPR